jgi:V/A-type H+/Na+-transporting ATPase subunit E
MEEIVSTDVIQGEILDDARRKAARMLEEAEAESERTMVAVEAKADAVVEEIMRTSAARSERFRMETMARLPLERTRMRTVFVDTRLREALAAYIDALGEDRVAFLAEEMLARGSSFLAGKAVVLGRSGLSEASARAIAGRVLRTAESVDFAEDDSLPAPGLFARARDGSVVLWATMDLLEERLLDEHRGEFARALCAEALDL